MEKVLYSDPPVQPTFSMPEESARKILEYLPDAILRLTGGGTILDYKPSSMNLLQVRDGRELVGRHVLELADMTPALDDELLERCVRQAHLALDRDEPQCFEVQLKESAWPLWLEIRCFRAGEDEVVVAIREVSRERRNRHYQEGELEEIRLLVQRMNEERDAKARVLSQRLASLAEKTNDEALARELRALMEEVTNPQLIEPRSLGDILQATIAELCGTSLEAHVRFDLCCEHLTPEVATGIHATVREALSCAAKHSSADRVRISLVNTKEVLSLLISDNATGDNADDARERAICLAKVRHQAQQLGGALRVTPGRRGTAMRLQLPLCWD